jgi:hypothetical protein
MRIVVVYKRKKMQINGFEMVIIYGNEGSTNGS